MRDEDVIERRDQSPHEEQRGEDDERGDVFVLFVHSGVGSRAFELESREFVDDSVCIGLPRSQRRRWKTRMIWRVREMLRLHAKAIAELIDTAALADVG